MNLYALTPAAEDDIREILAYIEQDNPSVVDRVRDGLRDAMRLIAERPGLGHARRLGERSGPVLASFQVTHHLSTRHEAAGDCPGAARQARGSADAGRMTCGRHAGGSVRSRT